MSLPADPQIGARRFLRSPALINVTPGLRIFSQYAEVFSGAVLVRVIANDCMTARQLVGIQQIVVVPRGLTSIEGEAPPADESPGVLFSSRAGAWRLDGSSYDGPLVFESPLHEMLRLESFDQYNTTPLLSQEFNVAQGSYTAYDPDPILSGLSYTAGPLPIMLIVKLWRWDGFSLQDSLFNNLLRLRIAGPLSQGWFPENVPTTLVSQNNSRPDMGVMLVAESFQYFSELYFECSPSPMREALSESTTPLQVRCAITEIYQPKDLRCYTKRQFAFGGTLTAQRQYLPGIGEPVETFPILASPAARPPITTPGPLEVRPVGPRDPTGRTSV